MLPILIIVPPGGGGSGWFREGPSPFQTVLAMVGVKPGGTAVVLGAGDGTLAAELAGVTGLNGRTLVIDPSPGAEPKVAKAAADAGRLVEFESSLLISLPAGLTNIDVAIVNCQLGTQGRTVDDILGEAVRILRPGGRVVVIEGAPKKGFLGFGRSTGPAPMDGDEVCRRLVDAGLRATRVLGEEKGITYVEGVKSGTTTTTRTTGTTGTR